MRKQILLALALIALLGADIASAQSFFRPTMERAQRWDLSLGILQQGNESVGGQEGSRLELDSEIGWRFAFDYNFNNHFALGFGMEFVRPDYTATIVPQDTDVPEQISYTADVFTGQLRGIWNIFDGPLTPFLEGNIGWTSFDSNVADGPPSTGCWWGPWGYQCANFWSTYSASNLSYGGGVGIRWDFDEQFFAKASYNLLIIDSSNSQNVQFPSGRLMFGWRF